MSDTSAKHQDLLIDVNALRVAMEATIAGTTEDHSKWVAFKSYAATHQDLAKRYSSLTGEPAAYYDADKLPRSGATRWPTQKEYFETVYSEILKIHGRLSKQSLPQMSVAFADLLHPVIQAASIKHYASGDYRNATLDAIVALFDMLRNKTGLDMDGDNLCNQAFSPSDPILILSEIETDSGRNDQRGFMDIFKGFYRGVRNPKAHSLIHDLDAIKSAQHLILASLLARRIDESKVAAGKR